MVLDDDVVAAVEACRREAGTGLSETINQLIRKGLSRPPHQEQYRHRSRDLGLRIDVSNVGDALDALDDR